MDPQIPMGGPIGGYLMQLFDPQTRARMAAETAQIQANTSNQQDIHNEYATHGMSPTWLQALAASQHGQAAINTSNNMAPVYSAEARHMNAETDQTIPAQVNLTNAEAYKGWKSPDQFQQEMTLRENQLKEEARTHESEAINHILAASNPQQAMAIASAVAEGRFPDIKTAVQGMQQKSAANVQGITDAMQRPATAAQSTTPSQGVGASLGDGLHSILGSNGLGGVVGNLIPDLGNAAIGTGDIINHIFGGTGTLGNVKPWVSGSVSQPGIGPVTHQHQGQAQSQHSRQGTQSSKNAGPNPNDVPLPLPSYPGASYGPSLFGPPSASNSPTAIPNKNSKGMSMDDIWSMLKGNSGGAVGMASSNPNMNSLLMSMMQA